MGKKGIKFSEEHKKKISEANKGKPKSEQARKNMSISKKGKTSPVKGKHWKISLQGRINIGNGHRGEKAYNWRGGQGLHFTIRNCFKYRLWRDDVFTRDNFTCQECGKRGGNLEAHHIKRFIDILEEYNIKSLEEANNCEELWNINNGQTLCKKCHEKTDTYFNKYGRK